MNDSSQKELARAKRSLPAAKQEDRAIGDYDIHIEIEQDTGRKRVADAGKFVRRITEYSQTPPP